MILPPCTSCASCCRNQIVPVTQADAALLPPGMYESRAGYHAVMRKASNGDCIALSGNRCAIYEHRPDVCRRFERDGALCNQARKGCAE